MSLPPKRNEAAELRLRAAAERRELAGGGNAMRRRRQPCSVGTSCARPPVFVQAGASERARAVPRAAQKQKGGRATAQALEVVSFCVSPEIAPVVADLAVRATRTRLPCGAWSAGALITIRATPASDRTEYADERELRRTLRRARQRTKKRLLSQCVSSGVQV